MGESVFVEQLLVVPVPVAICTESQRDLKLAGPLHMW